MLHGLYCIIVKASSEHTWWDLVGSKMDKYRCSVCGWIYDPELGDPDGGVAPGTPFENMPDDWQCPMCGAAKNEFQQLDD